MAQRATRDPHEVDGEFWAELRQFYDKGEIIGDWAIQLLNRFKDALRMEPTK